LSQNLLEQPTVKNIEKTGSNPPGTPPAIQLTSGDKEPRKETTMYALINTMPAVDNIIGRIVSTHRTIEAAERSNAQLQRLTKQFPGDTSYVPTRIVKLNGRYAAKALIGRDAVAPDPDFDASW
jgi:hypothetical protein